MIWGWDAELPPSREEMQRQFVNGWQFACGYIGGAADRVWLPSEWQDVRQSGLSALPIWVAPPYEEPGWQRGIDEGRAAVKALLARGMHGVLALDVENGHRPIQYAAGFIESAAAAEVGVVLYGSPLTIDAIGNLNWSAWWLASWVPVRWPSSAAPPDWSMWQFQSSGAYDLDLAVDSFAFAWFPPDDGA